MRNRTELKTTKLEGSDYEDEVSDGDDSGEDWQPAKDDGTKGKKGAVAKVGSAKKPAAAAAAGKRKAPAAKSPKGGATKKKAKKESSDEEDVEDEEDVDESDEDFDDSEDEEEEDVKNGDGTKKKRSGKKEGADPNGVYTLYVKKMDLKSGLTEQQNLFMWKRDGSSLLQRFKQNKTDKDDDYIFTPTTVYSCWEDRRKDEYFEVKTSAAGGDGQVTIVDKEEFAKFIEQSKSYEKPESEEENEEDGEGDAGENSEEDEEGEEDGSDEEEES
ncbi:hypothetical protein DMENIID0001_090560 [Sergentomyia squamirostris]